MEKIVNKIKESGLIQLDLAEYKPKIEVVGIDLSEQLWQGLVIKEKDFRAWIKEVDWSTFSKKAVFIHCSTDAIVPVWAYMLVVSKLQSVGAKAVVGDSIALQKELILEKIKQQDASKYQGERLIIKGCSDIPEPAFAMSELLKFLQPVAKSIMFGEPCSTVPIYKQAKK